jgi:competence protein ComEC
MKLLNFTIIKLTFCLVIGICIRHFIRIPLNYSLVASCILLGLLLISFLIAKNQFQKTIWFGLITFLSMISLGVLVENVHHQKNFKTHYSNVVTIDNSSTKTFTFRIREKLKSGNYYDKYIVDILKIEDQTVSGKSLLNVLKDSFQNDYKIDAVLIASTEFKDLIHPLNPNQFDYKNYLAKQYIYHQIFTDNNSIYKINSEKHTAFGLADALRETINSKLNNYNFKPDELAIIKALILGQRQDISSEIYNSYTNAGAIHILAVSGLHVGIILLLLTFVLKPIEYIKKGKVIKVVLILIFLWSFAIIAGLSASVTRAVTMFSIIAIAMHWKRPTNIYNTLAISIFILLLFKPTFLLDVGFQMSYLAVIAIVSIQPLIYKLWKPNLKAIDYLWQIFTVTVAAQFGVIPISLYYFHQFPSLFFVSNLAIIPFLGVILGFGILIIILALLNSLPNFLANAYGSIISWMNTVVNWVSKQEQFLFKDISFSWLHVIAWYVLIVSLVKLYKKRSVSNLSLMLVSILMLQGVSIYHKHENQTNEFIVFHKSRFSLIAHKTNTTLQIAHNFDSLTFVNDKLIKNFKVGNFITNSTEDTLNSVYTVNDKTLLVIDSLGVYNVKTFQPDFVLLRNSPKINLQRIIDSLSPKLIIADGSNYKSYIKRWEATCIKQKRPFYQTSKKGAYRIK